MLKTPPGRQIASSAAAKAACVYRTNEQGQVITDITRTRAKDVTPGVGFTAKAKRAPTEEELKWLERMLEAIRKLDK